MKVELSGKPDAGIPSDTGCVGVRLPCRGCGSDCKHYAICDGRPWRTLTPENTGGAAHSD
jgi:hypothetical protein